MCSITWRSWWSRRCTARRLRHADRTEGRQGLDRRVPRQATIEPRETSSLSRRWHSRPARTCVEEGVARATSTCAPSCSPAATVSTCQAGLTRVALKKGSLVVNPARAAEQNRHWVLDHWMPLPHRR